MKLVYAPRVLELIDTDERCWIRTKEEAGRGPQRFQNGRSFETLLYAKSKTSFPALI